MKPTPKPQSKTGTKTVEQFLAELAERDMSIADWCRQHKQPKNTVYALCGKRFNGTRGEARRVARAMGLALPPMHQQQEGAGAA